MPAGGRRSEAIPALREMFADQARRSGSPPGDVLPPLPERAFQPPGPDRDPPLRLLPDLLATERNHLYPASWTIPSRATG